MARKYSEEFREDVVRLIRGGMRVKQVSADMGVPEATLYVWLKRADIENGVKSGLKKTNSRSIVKRRSGSENWSRRTRSCAGLAPIFRRRTCREKDLPASARLSC